jgi:hypothetical protein
MNVADGDGVSKVEIRFRNEGDKQPASVYRSVNLDGETDTVAVIELRVDELLPGHYICDYVALTDGRGNQSLFETPGIEFRIEGDLQEDEGPALLNWSFA